MLSSLRREKRGGGGGEGDWVHVIGLKPTSNPVANTTLIAQRFKTFQSFVSFHCFKLLKSGYQYFIKFRMWSVTPHT